MAVLDLDRFKGVNDLHGHAAGDMLLKQVGERLCRLLNADIFIARLGGDEFAAILSNCKCDKTINAFGAEVSQALDAPYLVGGRLAVISSSIGVAIYPQGSCPPAWCRSGSLSSVGCVVRLPVLAG